MSLFVAESALHSPKTIKAIAPHLGVSYEDLIAKAGYIEKVVPRSNYEDVVWEEADGTFVDIYRRQVENICRRDSELINILDRAVNKSSDRDIDTIKKLLSGFMNDRLSDDQKTTLRTVIDSFAKR